MGHELRGFKSLNEKLSLYKIIILVVMNSFPESKLRLRMSSRDEHYAGKLVDGAKILNLFGDVATELTIRYDGDEGLLRAYKEIEFLAPVHSGDFIEVIGKITEVGNTSRKMTFEAYKVITSNQDQVHDSSCDVLDPPILVAKAKGTSVVMKEKQRKNR